MAERIFLREVNLDQVGKTLLFYQNSFGNVSAVVWDAALVLAKYLNKRSRKSENWLKDMKVVELGSGLGCSGIAAACFGAEVILTDLPEAVPQLLKTIEINRIPIAEGFGRAEAMELTWGSSVNSILERLDGPANIILVSDCIYYEQSIYPLVETIKALAGSRTEILLCQEIREGGHQRYLLDSFMESFIEEFDHRVIEESEQDEVYHSPDIYLISAVKKH